MDIERLVGFVSYLAIFADDAVVQAAGSIVGVPGALVPELEFI